MSIETLAINTLKLNGVAAVNKANSGHPGVVISAAKIVYTLFRDHMNYDPSDPKWINRDRFVLSAGHGSALLYSLYYSLGMLTREDLLNFRQLGSKTPGHPEFGHTVGVESTTGPLGQGIAIAAGLATAQAHLQSKFKEIDHYTYVLCGDGDLQEGISYEALSFVGQNKLNKFIVLYDSNDIQLDSPVSLVFKEDLKKRVESQGFNYFIVKNEVDLISAAITHAKTLDKPSFIEVKTIIGEDTPGANTSDVHGMPLGKDIEIFKANINWNHDDFYLDAQVVEHYKNTLVARSLAKKAKFSISEELAVYLEKAHKPITIDLNIAKNLATRASSGEIIKYLNKNLEHWIGGSADLSVSTKVAGADGIFSPQNYQGRNLMFGVREFAMAAIANGIALHSVLKPFVSTFFVFSDYLKPALRLSALMKLPVTYIFTHDSLLVGEDGPTHEPIEQLAMIRSIPNVHLMRPADEIEMKSAYEIALNSTDKPSVIVASRQNIVSQENTDGLEFKKGAYLLRKSESQFAIISTGSELELARQIAQKFDLNLISLSHWSTKPIWDADKAISIELASTFGWQKHAKYNFGYDDFGFSAPAEKILEHIGFTFENISKEVAKIIQAD
ncbi:Transketolase [Mesomycoplasma conjunctivae]|uniref:transketolase n=1 Tax=Mesomycoplasma conjunctivae (strain ATCC 25834 / NCTC 10147 / HRC/581) TaxID=572263 RepID=C5J6B1_MESCH|nr:transketolase [Mesomycoplasma conjunctivae]CAT05003.1 Transketolase [Mesomycoplasma conjunctivae]VEU66336.1 Transketolase [Mesomycoplasma conjunctivae]